MVNRWSLDKSFFLKIEKIIWEMLLLVYKINVAVFYINRFDCMKLGKLTPVFIALGVWSSLTTLVYGEQGGQKKCDPSSSYWSSCIGIRNFKEFTYEGEFRSNVIHGYGKAAWLAVDKTYEGAWRNGLQYGYGTEITNRSDGKFIYKGEFLKGRKDGKGKFIHEGIREYVGDFVDGKFHGEGTLKLITEDLTYIGQWVKGKRSGYGTEIDNKNGYEYFGEWIDDHIHGYGVVRYNSGAEYKGTFVKGKRHGDGEFTYASGDKYIGQFRSNLFSGNGEIVYVSGNRFVGYFKNGLKYGKGKTFFSSSTRSENYLEGKLNGPAVETSNDGSKKISMNFIDGKLDGEQIIEFQDGSTKYSYYSNGKKLTCSEEAKACEDSAVCLLATVYKNNKTIWREIANDPYIKEAKSRNLDCGVEEPVQPAKLNLSGSYGDFHVYKHLADTVFFDGEVDQGDNLDLRRAMRNHELKYVVLNSPGGLVFEGLTMAGTIHDNELTTVVPKNAVCASACSFMFFAGVERQAQGQLGVHQFFSAEKGRKADVSAVEDITQYTTSEIIGFLNNFNTPAWVFEKMFAERDMYFFDTAELRELSTIALNSNLISQFNKQVSAVGNQIVSKPKAVQKKPEPVYEAVKETIYLDVIESEWSYETLIVTARNSSSHDVKSPKIEFRFGNCKTPGSPTIKQAQQRLNQLGFNVGRPDGRFGPKTANGVRAFQKQQLIKITGELDDQTLRRLKLEPDQDFMQGITGIPLGGTIKPNASALIYFDNFGLFTQGKAICYRVVSDVYVQKLKKIND